MENTRKQIRGEATSEKGDVSKEHDPVENMRAHGGKHS